MTIDTLICLLKRNISRSLIQWLVSKEYQLKTVLQALFFSFEQSHLIIHLFIYFLKQKFKNLFTEQKQHLWDVWELISLASLVAFLV